jgi:hypothetical protein
LSRVRARARAYAEQIYHDHLKLVRARPERALAGAAPCAQPGAHHAARATHGPGGGAHARVRSCCP